ncbi:MAG TPA: glycosyltransferase family 2 protein [Thermosynechococcaceae cyanobacterium]
MGKTTYIIIPVHNRKLITLRCLENLKQVEALQQFQVLVIDDGSTDGTGEAVRSHYPEVEVLQGDGNLWWTGAIAEGMQYAYEQGAAFFIWLNDDCQLGGSVLLDLVQTCQEDPRVIVGAQGVEQNDPSAIAFGGKLKTWQGYRFISVSQGHQRSCDLLSGNLVCMPREVVQKIGYPDSAQTPHYGGDSLYLIRAQKAGFHLLVSAKHPVYSLPGEPKLFPSRWLLSPGEPLKILKLVFVPQSGLSWRVWLRINWEAYSAWGLVMFLKKYCSILLITLLRFLPLSMRKDLHKFISLKFHDPEQN